MEHYLGSLENGYVVEVWGHLTVFDEGLPEAVGGVVGGGLEGGKGYEAVGVGNVVEFGTFGGLACQFEAAVSDGGVGAVSGSSEQLEGFGEDIEAVVPGAGVECEVGFGVCEVREGDFEELSAVAGGACGAGYGVSEANGVVDGWLLGGFGQFGLLVSLDSSELVGREPLRLLDFLAVLFGPVPPEGQGGGGGERVAREGVGDDEEGGSRVPGV